MNRRAAMVIIGIAATTGACGHSASSGTVPSPSAATAVGCRTTVASVDVSTWREIPAEGFTFCVPPDWRGGGRTWRRGSAQITWGKGTHPREEVAVVTGTVVAPAGGGSESPSAPLPNSDVQRFTEEIGGRPASVWRNRFGQDYHTGADWESLRIWIVGKAADPTAADLEVTIFRTVRFQSR